jgi:hypothetical protein
MCPAAFSFDTLAPAHTDNARSAINRQPTTREAQFMNLYLLFAIALGAISGTAEVTVVRSGLASVVNECRGMRSEQSVVSPRSALHHARSESSAARGVDQASVRIQAPLTGAGTSRAPATNC